MGVSLRTCKEKFYGCVHEALSVWVGAAREDGWHFQDVRQGPPKAQSGSPVKGSPVKKREQPPRLDVLRLELGGDDRGGVDDGGWL